MNGELQIVKTENFEGIRFDCYQDGGKEFWGTREQIGEMLGYAEPNKAIGNIHDRNRERLDRFSTSLKLRVLEGGREVQREMTVYSFKGLLEICRYSNQPKADAVMDFLWDIADEIRKKGSYTLNKSAPAVPKIGRGIMSGAKMIFKTAGLKDNQLSLALDRVYAHYAGVSALGVANVRLEAPDARQIMTPTEIGRMLDISARRVNDLLAGAGYQHRIGDKWEPLEPGEPYAVMLDTNKRHGDGTPVRQLKWDSSIVEVVRELARDAA